MSASWHEDLVRDVFLPINSGAILKIPLSTRNIDDFWAWNEDGERKLARRMLVQLGLGWREQSLVFIVEETCPIQDKYFHMEASAALTPDRGCFPSLEHGHFPGVRPLWCRRQYFGTTRFLAAVCHAAYGSL